MKFQLLTQHGVVTARYGPVTDTERIKVKAKAKRSRERSQMAKTRRIWELLGAPGARLKQGSTRGRKHAKKTPKLTDLGARKVDSKAG